MPAPDDQPPPPPAAGPPEFIRGLLRADAYPHPVDDIRLIETHISWLLLTGPHAYKLKKPVDLGFLDFSTLEKRHQACEQELRLNKRLAPALYQQVVTVTGSPEAPRMDGGSDQPVLEYAVRMQQFDPEQGLDRLLEKDALPPGLLDELAVRIAEFHRQVPRADGDQAWGSPEAVGEPIAHNFPAIEPSLHDATERARLETLRLWAEEQQRLLRDTIVARRADGWVRECHGDLHLGNVVLHQGHPLVFDCLEFNPGLRWIDVISELAFTTMDLKYRGRSDLANRFLNVYLEHSGDYAGLSLLRLYQVYRTLVRAKVTAIRERQQADPGKAGPCSPELRHYLQLATDYTRTTQPMLVITHGLSGSGKTTWTSELLQHLPGSVRIRSDVERKRLYGLGPLDSSRAGTDPCSDSDTGESSDTATGIDIYTPEASSKTYARLLELARGLLRDGYTAIVEATFLLENGRQPFRQLADELGVEFRILDFQAAAETLEQRVTERQRRGGDASEADLRILRGQIGGNQPFSERERPFVIGIDTENQPDMAAIARRLQTQ